jgi:hypothetical protein
MEPDKDGNYTVMIFDGNRPNRAGYQYGDLAKAIKDKIAKSGPIPVCYGPPIDSATTVNTDRICGVMDHPTFLEESGVIMANFKPSGAFGGAADIIINATPTANFSVAAMGKPRSPKFGVRALGQRHRDGKFDIEQLISIDFISE